MLAWAYKSRGCFSGTRPCPLTARGALVKTARICLEGGAEQEQLVLWARFAVVLLVINFSFVVVFVIALILRISPKSRSVSVQTDDAGATGATRSLGLSSGGRGAGLPPVRQRRGVME